jgi:hypothetical protein
MTEERPGPSIEWALPEGGAAALDLYEELAGIIDLLNEAGIDYAVCGGIALALHGFPRYTKDIDLLVREEDVERIQALVARRGFDLPPAHLPFDIGTERERRVVRISKIENREHLILDLLLVTRVRAGLDKPADLRVEGTVASGRLGRGPCSHEAAGGPWAGPCGSGNTGVRKRARGSRECVRRSG